MRITRHFASCVALAAAMLAAVSAWAADDANNTKEKELIAVLQSADSSKPDKAITCKKLAVFGSKDAVPALAPLLNDEELISWTRIALEAIPGPEADEVLIHADVNIINDSSGKKISVKTDDFGDFWVDELNPDTYDVVLRKDGYTEKRMDADITVNDINLVSKFS